MNIEQLEFIVEVAKTGSLTKTAQNMHVTLSAISQSITNLETELGIKLFIRSRAGAKPTIEGEKIIRKAFQVVTSIQEIREEAENYNQLQSGELRIATIPGYTCYLVDGVSQFKMDYPNIKMEVMETPTEKIIEKINSREIDIGLTAMLEKNFTHSNMVYERILTGQMVLAVSRFTPLATQTTMMKQELKELTFVIYKDEIIKKYLEKLESEIGSIRILFSSNNTDAINTAVKNGLAVTIGPNYSFFNSPDAIKGDIVTVPIISPQTAPVYLGWLKHKEKKFSKPSSLFIERVKAQLQA
ncbi:LysR family transcriptional regulator [Bacillus rubiinfantis]|uniref:LysR family transcriptional regulator n=1 Tax=Bacillus rubiinfantis TaxID=1499680 RepID=UPI0005A7F10E|nr:LysR family transcriptional regulator [Bacillus rubiinfantis]